MTFSNLFRQAIFVHHEEKSLLKPPYKLLYYSVGRILNFILKGFRLLCLVPVITWRSWTLMDYG